MKTITMQTRTVYTIDRWGRRKTFLSLRSACKAVARDRIEEKYPKEHAEYEEYGITYPGFMWQHDLPRGQVLYRRLTRLVMQAYKLSIGAKP